MIDPTRHRQLEETNMVEQCVRIFQNARNELYLNMRFFDLSLSSLGFEANLECRGIGTDGYVIFYHPDYVCGLYGHGRVLINRTYLHMVLHCLFCHMDTRKNRTEELWNLACDIGVESMLDRLHLRCVHVPATPYRRELYERLGKRIRVLNAEGIYEVLQDMKLSPQQFERMQTEFLVDDHQFWKLSGAPQKTEMVRQNQWNKNRETLQTELETMGDQEDMETRNLLEQVQVENRERYDYKQFLRKFSILREEIQVDPDSFDYAFYTYGLSLYGNMPLLEPLESREVVRIEDFVIAIDTSMSCSGDLVRRFLEETYDVLCESESYFKRINIHIIQCDERVQSDCLIQSKEDMESYMQNLTIMGQGGTDFRPVFGHVNEMIANGAFHKLRGILYFTDGEGIYPLKRPIYETAFVFIKNQYTDVSVPPWAIKLILEPEQLREKKGCSKHEH